LAEYEQEHRRDIWGNYECRLGRDGQYGWINKTQPGNYNQQYLTSAGIYA
jgi:hypothetical protein